MHFYFPTLDWPPAGKMSKIRHWFYTSRRYSFTNVTYSYRTKFDNGPRTSESRIAENRLKTTQILLNHSRVWNFAFLSPTHSLFIPRWFSAYFAHSRYLFSHVETSITRSQSQSHRVWGHGSEFFRTLRSHCCCRSSFASRKPKRRQNEPFPDDGVPADETVVRGLR